MSLVALSKNGKNDKEKINDVYVDLEGTIDVLLWVQFMLLTPNNHLCVIDEELQINDKNINNSNKISIFSKYFKCIDISNNINVFELHIKVLFKKNFKPCFLVYWYKTIKEPRAMHLSYNKTPDDIQIVIKH